jgi:hypothetical protein
MEDESGAIWVVFLEYSPHSTTISLTSVNFSLVKKLLLYMLAHLTVKHYID